MPVELTNIRAVVKVQFSLISRITTDPPVQPVLWRGLPSLLKARVKDLIELIVANI